MIEAKKESYGSRLKKDLIKNKTLYLLVLPVIAFYIIFCYMPMYGIVIAFQNFDPAYGFTGSPWVGLENFFDFFSSASFARIFKNTFTISLSGILFGFPAPIILALLINELTNKRFVKLVQTITYLPHFISLVVVCGMIKDFTSSGGIITQMATSLGSDGLSMLMDKNLFVPI